MGATLSEGDKPCQPSLTRWLQLKKILTLAHTLFPIRGIVTAVEQPCLVFLTLLQKGSTPYEYLG